MPSRSLFLFSFLYSLFGVIGKQENLYKRKNYHIVRLLNTEIDSNINVGRKAYNI